MKKKSLIMATCVALALGLGGVVLANAPVLNVTSPTGTQTVGGFPVDTSIVFTITHSELKNLNVLDVQVNGSSILPDGNPVGNPFNNSNNPSNNLTNAGLTATTNGLDFASVTAPWTVTDPGTYTIAVSVKHQGDTGEDIETVIFAIVAVEYPAPPAVANAYINAVYKSVAPKQRGSIISVIAENQAKSEKYGPRGGPYDENLIKADVDALITP